MTIKRILIFKMWALGDILMATPLLRALKRQYPGCEITWLADKFYADVLDANPLLHDVIAFDSGEWKRQFRSGRLLQYWRTSTALRRDLEARSFDVVLNLTPEKWWALWFNAAPIRVGLFPRARAGLMGRFYTHVVERNPSSDNHNIIHYLAAAAPLGIDAPYDTRMVVGVSERHRTEVDQFLRARSIFRAGRKLFVLHPGTSQESKCWLPEQFAELADLLAGEGCVVLTGSPSECELCERIAELSRSAVIVAAGSLSHIGQTAALLERADALVTGDTSVLHVASALETPTVAIYGSTRPGDNAPLHGRNALLFDDAVPCAPCYRSRCPLRGKQHMRCMIAIRLSDVLAALNKLGVFTNRNEAVSV